MTVQLFIYRQIDESLEQLFVQFTCNWLMNKDDSLLKSDPEEQPLPAEAEAALKG